MIAVGVLKAQWEAHRSVAHPMRIDNLDPVGIKWCDERPVDISTHADPVYGPADEELTSLLGSFVSYRMEDASNLPIMFC